MKSINTLLLEIFSKLCLHKRSFSVGALAFLDTNDEMFDQLVSTASTVLGGFYDCELSVPLDNQCNCTACEFAATTKRAIRFKKNGDYLLVKLVEHPFLSTNGVMEYMRLSLWGDEATIHNCAARHYSLCPYELYERDLETYHTILPKSDVAISLKEFAEYNKKSRVGSEFFVPSAIFKSTVI